MRRACLLVLLVVTAAFPVYAQQQPVTFETLMALRSRENTVFSDDGRVVAFTAAPDRGNPEGIVQRTDGGAAYTLPRASHPALSDDGAFAAFRLNAPLEAQERAKRDKKDAPEAGLLLVTTATGRVDTLSLAAKQYAFAPGSAVLAYGAAEPDTLDLDPSLPDSLKPEINKKQRRGKRLTLRTLASGSEATIPFVHDFAFSEDGAWIAYTIAHPDSTRDGLFARDLATGTTHTLDARANAVYGPLVWSKSGTLAFVAATEDAEGETADAALYTWDGNQPGLRVAADAAPDGWRIPVKTRLEWTDDGARLFFGLRPHDDDADDDTTVAPLDVDAILRARTVDVWHGDDPRINPQQKVRWKTESETSYRAVLHPDGRVVRLEDDEFNLSEVPQNPNVALARDDAPYRREMTWDGFYYDLYVVSLADGTRTRVTDKASGPASLSPDGRFVVFYADGTWFRYEVATGAQQAATDGLGVSFADELDDTPDAPSAYGFGGWMEGAQALVYDRYDVWALDLMAGTAAKLTDGRDRGLRFRVQRTDPEAHFYAANEPLLLEGFDEKTRAQGMYRWQPGTTRAAVLYTPENRRVDFVHQAKTADVRFFTEQAFDVFPDLYRADLGFGNRRRLTNLNPQIDDLRWGHAQIVSWTDLDGQTLDGILYTPEDFDPSRKYPMLVYFYERLSDGLYTFAPTAVNHRPAYPLYLSDDYLVFLPDVTYEVGRPGLSAVKAIVPGVQSLIAKGFVDADHVGIHGHSWGGYESAFLVTQTNMFAAASTGAPVSNMTSAYGGIRWGSGLARQFQYEQTQSRLGVSLWEGRDRYVDNSPLFFADRIHTPLLIFHGDADGSVPWYQSIELYLALRRLNREVVFLQYRGEDHHPAAYANKLDWAMRMKQWFDHYLKGEPGPAWITEGALYAGD